MSCKEAGKKGGSKTLETHGPEFYSEIGRKGGSQSKSKKLKKD